MQDTFTSLLIDDGNGALRPKLRQHSHAHCEVVAILIALNHFPAGIRFGGDDEVALVAVAGIRAHWDEILRLATSIRPGTVTAPLKLRELGSYPRQNSLAVALRELGRIERTLLILDWLQSVKLRRRIQAGLHKGEAHNALVTSTQYGETGRSRINTPLGQVAPDFQSACPR